MAAVGSQDPDMVELEAHAASREKVDASTPALFEDAVHGRPV